MTPYYERNSITIYHGDAREVLPALGPGPADVTITDPVWPNASPKLAGCDRPLELLAEVVALLPRPRLVIHLGCNSDPRILTAIPADFVFFRTCWLEYTRAAYYGRLLYKSDVAYAFGRRAIGIEIEERYCEVAAKRLMQDVLL